jgi:hypothetical protein
MASPEPFYREIPELIEALQRHTRLLREFARHAFQGQDNDYLGEVAGKLRLLVHERKDIKPLLLGLMDEFGLDVPIMLDGPPISRPPGHSGPWYGDQISLRDYLDLTAYGIRTSSQGFVELTKKKLIATWAEKHGSAHEDWTLTEEFVTARDSGLFLGNLPALATELQITTRTVLYIAEKFLGMLTDELIKLKSAERHLKHNPHSLPAGHVRGAALGKLHRYEEAIEEFQKVIKAESTNFRAHNDLGLALHHLGRFPEAIKAYQQAIALDENYADAHYNLACTYALQRDFSQCLEELECTKRLDGFAGKINPALDPDLATIRGDPQYGPSFSALIGIHEKEAEKSTFHRI